MSQRGTVVSDDVHAARGRVVNMPTRGELVRARFRQLQAVIEGLDEERGNADHDHRGPNPCPVCGGRKPEVQ
jgi:hypothetical protein